MLARTPIYDENGDILAPEFFVESQAKLAGVFNSGLDRDNFGENDIASGEFTAADRPFNAVHQNTSETTYPPDITLTSWQGADGNDGSGIHSETFTADADGLYLLYWSGAWSWSGAYSFSTSGGAADRADTKDVVDTIRFRIVVDGSPVKGAMSLPFEDANEYHSTYLVGAIVLAQGTHTVGVACQCARRVTQTMAVRGGCTNQPSILERILLIRARER